MASSFIIIISVLHLANRWWPGYNLKFRADNIIYFIIIVIGACYSHSGVEKLEISPNGWEWFVNNDLTNNIMAMYNRGWLASTPAMHEIILTFFGFTQVPGQFLILAGEMAFVLFLFHKKTSQWMAGVIILLHLGVFIMNGALFWMWIIADIGIIILLGNPGIKLNWKSGIAGAFCILFAIFLLDIRTLGWYDSPVDNRFELFSGNTPISEASMSPYTQNFQMGNFLPLVNKKVPGPGFLIFDYETYQRLSELGKEEILPFIKANGHNRYDPEIKKNMKSFLHSFLTNHKPNPVAFLKPPSYWNAHLFSTRQKVEGSELDKISIYHRFDWNRDHKTILLKRTMILQVKK